METKNSNINRQNMKMFQHFFRGRKTPNLASGRMHEKCTLKIIDQADTLNKYESNKNTYQTNQSSNFSPTINKSINHTKKKQKLQNQDIKLKPINNLSKLSPKNHSRKWSIQHKQLDPYTILFIQSCQPYQCQKQYERSSIYRKVRTSFAIRPNNLLAHNNQQKNSSDKNSYYMTYTKPYTSIGKHRCKIQKNISPWQADINNQQYSQTILHNYFH